MPFRPPLRQHRLPPVQEAEPQTEEEPRFSVSMSELAAYLENAFAVASSGVGRFVVTCPPSATGCLSPAEPYKVAKARIRALAEGLAREAFRQMEGGEPADEHVQVHLPGLLPETRMLSLTEPPTTQRERLSLVTEALGWQWALVGHGMTSDEEGSIVEVTVVAGPPLIGRAYIGEDSGHAIDAALGQVADYLEENYDPTYSGEEGSETE